MQKVTMDALAEVIGGHLRLSIAQKYPRFLEIGEPVNEGLPGAMFLNDLESLVGYGQSRPVGLFMMGECIELRGPSLGLNQARVRVAFVKMNNLFYRANPEQPCAAMELVSNLILLEVFKCQFTIRAVFDYFMSSSVSAERYVSKTGIKLKIGEQSASTDELMTIAALLVHVYVLLMRARILELESFSERFVRALVMVVRMMTK
jgi:hypothetical protein